VLGIHTLLILRGIVHPAAEYFQSFFLCTTIEYKYKGCNASAYKAWKPCSARADQHVAADKPVTGYCRQDTAPQA
jgi:hypothetical protein